MGSPKDNQSVVRGLGLYTRLELQSNDATFAQFISHFYVHTVPRSDWYGSCHFLRDACDAFLVCSSQRRNFSERTLCTTLMYYVKKILILRDMLVVEKFLDALGHVK